MFPPHHAKADLRKVVMHAKITTPDKAKASPHRAKLHSSWCLPVWAAPSDLTATNIALLYARVGDPSTGYSYDRQTENFWSLSCHFPVANMTPDT